MAHSLISYVRFLKASPPARHSTQMMARILVDKAIKVTGRKQIVRQKTDRNTAKLTAEIRTIHKARNIIRALVHKEVEKREEANTLSLLEALLDRLVRVNLS